MIDFVTRKSGAVISAGEFFRKRHMLEHILSLSEIQGRQYENSISYTTALREEPF